jgi:A/G-specific adenine glycosylase
MVAEFMLQQTQAERVVPKYIEFLEAFPSMESLATAKKREILKRWSGLGYNRRALWLQEACEKILVLGEFPLSPRELRALKGIGPYTSRSILIFAFNADLAAVDTNVRRVLIHEGFASVDLSNRELLRVAELLVPKGRSRDWHNALMDYGALEITTRATGIRSRNRQPRFRGSVREARGLLLRQVVERGVSDVLMILEEQRISRKILAKAKESLLREKILFEKDGKLFLNE